MNEFKENFMKLLPMISSIVLTIVIVGGGFLMTITKQAQKTENQINNIEENIMMIRGDIKSLDRSKVDKEVFAMVLQELRRLNEKLDRMQERELNK